MSDSMGMDVQKLITNAGGVGKLAQRLGVKHSTVCDWKRTGWVPGNRVSQISKELGVSASEVLTLVRSVKAKDSETGTVPQ